MEGSKISEFYRDKNIFITGATGFVGKLLIDKLLRCSQPKALYLLIRPKRSVEAQKRLKELFNSPVSSSFSFLRYIIRTTGFVGKLLIDKLLRCSQPKALYLLIRPKQSVEPQKRLKELFNSPVFDKLKTTVPDYMKRLILVSGDMMEPGLGLADADRKVLIDNIHVVFHGAATVRFDEPLPIATRINVIGTKTILQLCKKMKNLESVVYVSTAFSNCPYDRIEEEFYDPPITSENLIKLAECLKEHQLEQITSLVLDKWPNTYAFTKAVAEEAVKIHGKGLPLAVFRPAIMVSTRSEPIPGWIDNLYGPTGVMVGYAAGIIRAIRFDPDKKTDVVPADMTINCLVAVGYKTSLYHPSDLNIPIYNFTTHNNNQLLWKDFVNISNERALETPTSRGIWYYSLTNCKSIVAYTFLAFLVHTLPALIVDIGLVLMNKKPRALKMYKKVHKYSEVISHFSLRSWDFATDNVNSLWHTLGKKDKKIYDFDMASLDWHQFLRDTADGIRLYMLEDKMETVSYAKKRFMLLWVLHRSVQIIFFTVVAWSLMHLITFASWMVAAR